MSPAQVSGKDRSMSPQRVVAILARLIDESQMLHDLSWESPQRDQWADTARALLERAFEPKSSILQSFGRAQAIVFNPNTTDEEMQEKVNSILTSNVAVLRSAIQQLNWRIEEGREPAHGTPGDKHQRRNPDSGPFAPDPNNNNQAQPLPAWAYVLIAFIGLVLGIGLCFFYAYKGPTLPPDGSQNLIYYILLIPCALGCAAFLFGAMRAYALYTQKHPGNALILGGPVVVFCIVLFGGLKLIPVPNPVPRDVFELTVRVDGEAGPVTTGKITAKIDDFDHAEYVRPNGEANFRTFPLRLKDRTIGFFPEVSGYEASWQQLKSHNGVIVMQLKPLSSRPLLNMPQPDKETSKITGRKHIEEMQPKNPSASTASVNTPEPVRAVTDLTGSAEKRQPPQGEAFGRPLPPNDAKEAYDRALKAWRSDGSTSNALKELAKALRIAPDYEAAKQLKADIKREHESTTKISDPVQQGMLDFNWATTLLSSDDPDAAIEYYDRSIREMPKFASLIQEMRSAAYYRAEKFQASIRDATAVINDGLQRGFAETAPESISWLPSACTYRLRGYAEQKLLGSMVSEAEVDEREAVRLGCHGLPGGLDRK